MYQQLNKKDIFIYLPRVAGDASSVMRNSIFSTVKDSQCFTKYNLVSSDDFIPGCDRQEAFVSKHNSCSVAVYPVCAEFLDEFQTSFHCSVTDNKVIFVLCEDNTSVPEQWSRLEMVNFLPDSIDYSNRMNRLTKGMCAILNRYARTKSSEVLNADVAASEARRRSTEFSSLDGTMATDHTGHCVRKELLQTSDDPSTKPGW